MDEEMELEFNDKIMKALMKKVQDSTTRCDVLEKDLGVKEAELQYLAKLYDDETSSLTQDLEREKEKAVKLEGQLNEITDKFSELNKELTIIKSEKDKLNSKIPSMEEETEKLREELQCANNKINELQKNNSQLKDQIQELSEEIRNKDTIIKNKDTIIEEQQSLNETLELELKEYKGPESNDEDLSAGDRLKCVQCGSVGKDIKVVEDKSKALSYVGNMPMYAKYHVCKKCGYKF
jgi:chromosome segregation ATPase